MFGKWSLIFEVRWGFIFQLHDLAASWEWVWFAFSALEYYLGVMVASIFVGYMEGVCKNHFFLLKVLIILPCLVRILWFPSVMCVARKIFLMDLGLHFWWDSIFLGFVFRELKFSSCPIFSFEANLGAWSIICWPIIYGLNNWIGCLEIRLIMFLAMMPKYEHGEHGYDTPFSKI